MLIDIMNTPGDTMTEHLWCTIKIFMEGVAGIVYGIERRNSEMSEVGWSAVGDHLGISPKTT